MKICLSLFLSTSIFISKMSAFPSALFWTTCCTDVIPTGKGCFQTGNYFTIINRSNAGQFFPADIGFSVGLLSWRDWKMEAGIDYLGGLKNPLFFNAKVGIEEDKLFTRAPSFSVGGFWFGTRSNMTNYNVIDAVVGKTLPKCLSGGRVFLGTYFGSHTLGRDRAGYMLGYTKTFYPSYDKLGSKYWKWWFLADYASGKNFIGGGGLGIAYFFNSQASVITGPCWFNDKSLMGNGNGQYSSMFSFRSLSLAGFSNQIGRNLFSVILPSVGFFNILKKIQFF